MKEKIAMYFSLVLCFAMGCFFGGYALMAHLRMNALEANQAVFQQNVEQFAKQVNEEFLKRPIKTKDINQEEVKK